MTISKIDPVAPIYKDHIIAAAEELMINCHHLASDLLDLAQTDSAIEPNFAQIVSRQLSHWATQLAATVEVISQERDERASVTTH